MTDGRGKAPPWVWGLIGAEVLVLLLGVLAPLAAYGIRKYLVSAKQAEARTALVAWSSGLASCGQRDGQLPPTTSPVPPSLSDVQGKKWQSTPVHWSEPGFSCARFSMTAPQHFQYQWQSRGASAGTAMAMADLDADGLAEQSFSVEVTCRGGSCAAGSLTDVAAAALQSQGPGKTEDAPLNPLSLMLGGVGSVGVLVCAIWLLIAAFQVSIGWGFGVLLVPCARWLLVIKHWEKAKRPFLFQLASEGLVFLGVLLLLAQSGAVSPSSPPVPVASVTVDPSVGAGAAPPPVVVPPLTGGAVDLSTVMGRARKLADAWQPEAALLGIQATLADGKIQTQNGASAKVTFGPSPFAFAKTRATLFVVTYDETGIHGAPTPGEPGKALPEPMCAPERLLTRLTFAPEGPVKVTYALDGAGRPRWIVGSVQRPKDQSAFDPQNCSNAALK